MSKVEVYIDNRGKRRKTFLIRWVVNFLAILVTAKLVNGIVLDGVITVFIAAFILGIVNSWVRPFLFVVSLPFTLVTLGLFTFVINAFMLLLTAAIIPGFVIMGFWSAFWGAILISIFSSVISAMLE